MLAGANTKTRGAAYDVVKRLYGALFKLGGEGGQDNRGQAERYTSEGMGEYTVYLKPTRSNICWTLIWFIPTMRIGKSSLLKLPPVMA